LGPSYGNQDEVKKRLKGGETVVWDEVELRRNELLLDK